MTFLDTNVVVYANDSRDQRKQSVSLDLVTQYLLAGTGVISSQVLQEYASVAVTKLHQHIAVVTHQLHLLESLRVVLVDATLVRRALELHQLYQISFWDAQIVASAESAGCDTLLSEDLNPGQFYAGMRCVNPFA